mmetsp:Transcript_12489/g.36840  ORF Transcript_12489/g.36840 Transcript_12489/m.36840 type:complete len:231 (+) Transcript_12489:1719-2411(+)
MLLLMLLTMRLLPLRRPPLDRHPQLHLPRPLTSQSPGMGRQQPDVLVGHHQTRAHPQRQFQNDAEGFRRGEDRGVSARAGRPVRRDGRGEEHRRKHHRKELRGRYLDGFFPPRKDRAFAPFSASGFRRRRRRRGRGGKWRDGACLQVDHVGAAPREMERPPGRVGRDDQIGRRKCHLLPVPVVQAEGDVVAVVRRDAEGQADGGRHFVYFFFGEILYILCIVYFVKRSGM